MKNIILIETEDADTFYTGEAIKQMGYTPIFLCSMQEFEGDTRKQIQEYLHYNVDTKTSKNILKFIQHKKIQNIRSILTLEDAKLPLVVELASYFNVPGNDKASSFFNDKTNILKVLPKQTPASLVFSSINIPWSKLEAFLIKFKKIIFKPSHSAGSKGIFVITTLQELYTIEKKIKAFEKKYSLTTDWILQEFIEGSMASIVGYVIKEKITFLGFTSYEDIGFISSKAYFPADRTIPSHIQKSIKQSVEVMIEKTCFQNGYFHVQFIYNRKGYITDPHLGRMQGATGFQNLALSFKKDPIEVLKHFIAVTLQFPFPNIENFYDSPPLDVISIRYGLKKGATLLDLKIPPGNFFHTSLYDAGSNIPALGNNVDSRVGMLAGHPKDVLPIIDQIQIITNKGTFSPYY